MLKSEQGPEVATLEFVRSSGVGGPIIFHVLELKVALQQLLELVMLFATGVLHDGVGDLDLCWEARAFAADETLLDPKSFEYQEMIIDNHSVFAARSSLTLSSCSAHAMATTRNSSSNASEVNHLTGGQDLAPQLSAKWIRWSQSRTAAR
mmetsp:Transcript_23870/g.66836  ORF Transcript_23870/g.66836 Transcript_23870/m.66836 type:complete len:150 (+) Transcript_23870:396-845(+)